MASLLPSTFNLFSNKNGPSFRASFGKLQACMITVTKSKTYIERIFTRADIKFVKSLNERSFRYANKLFVAEGNKSVQDILTSAIKVSRIFCLEPWFNQNYLHLPKDIEITFIHQKDLDQLTTLKSTREVLAVCEMQTLGFEPQTLLIRLNGTSLNPFDTRAWVRTAWPALPASSPSSLNPFDTRAWVRTRK